MRRKVFGTFVALGTLLSVSACGNFTTSSDGKKIMADFLAFPIQLNDGSDNSMKGLLTEEHVHFDQVTVAKNSDGSYSVDCPAGMIDHKFNLSSDESSITAEGQDTTEAMGTLPYSTVKKPLLTPR